LRALRRLHSFTAFNADPSGFPKMNISFRLKINFAENDLMEEAVVKEYFTTATDGKVKK